MVRIRLKRMGRRNRAFWRVVAADSRAPRDGKVIEVLGTYDPKVADPIAQISVKKERIEHWLSKGAQPSVEVAALLRRVGIRTKGR